MAARYWTLQGLILHLNQQKILQLFAEISSQETIAELPEDIVYAAICQHGSAVDAVVESYLRGHVPLPFVTVPPELTDMACALLACRLSAAQSEAELSEKMQAKEKAVIRFFEQIASGLIKFANLESAPAPSVWVNKQPGDAMFGIAGLRSRM